MFCSRFFIILLLIGFPQVQAENDCKTIFGSRSWYDIKALERFNKSRKYQPQFTSIIEEKELQKTWVPVPAGDVPYLFKESLPEGTGFISHQLRQPQARTSVKLEESGSALMVRAHYEYNGINLATNATISKKALDDNIKNSVKGLAGTNAQAAILFLHGGGTKSAGGHVAEALVNHFSGFNVDVISPDLPWHSEGPREFVGDFKDEIYALSAFAKKYIPEHIPVFVWGHSWGAAYAEKIMRLTENPDFSFHPNLKGTIIAAPPIDAAVGKSFKEKQDAALARYEYMMKNLKKEFAPLEGKIWEEIVSEGKTSPVSSFFAAFTTFQLNQNLPEHGGDKYIPSIMIVGEGDPLVYVGNGDLFRSYYDKLSNVKTYYLRDLPLAKDPKGKKYRVGHLIRDYVDPVTQSMPVDFYYVKEFISEQMGLPKLEKKPKLRKTYFADIAYLWANNLSFRLWIEDYIHFHIYKTEEFKSIRQETERIKKEADAVFLNYLLQNRIWNVVDSLIKPTEEPYEEILKEVKIIHQLISQEKGLNKKLDELFVNLKSSKNKEEMKSVVSEVKDNLNFIPTKTSSTKGRSRDMVRLRNIFNKENSYQELISFLEEFYVKENDKNFIIDSFIKVYDNDRLMNDIVIPSAEDFLKNNPQLSEFEINRLQHRIAKNIEQRRVLAEKAKQISNKKREKHKEYQELLQAVTTHIKYVKEIFSEFSLQPPQSLKEEYEESQKELEHMFQFSEQMENMITDLATNLIDGDSKDLKKVHDLFDSNPNKQNIQELSHLHKKYVANRVQLRKKLLLVAEQGEMGKKYQESVLALFGPSSQTQGDWKTSESKEDNLYTQLQKKTKELAILESQFLTLKTKQSAFFSLYYELLPYKPIGDVDMYRLSDIFNGRKKGESVSFENKEEVHNFLRQNESLFEKIYTIWKNLYSKIPPELPNIEE